MTDLSLQRVEQLFQQAADLPPGQRRVFLERECPDEPELRDRVSAMLDKFAEDRSLDAPVAEGPGMVIDRYKLLQKIGEGGFGVVYMAEQLKPVVRKVAFKIIKLGMDTKEVVARFEAERQALALMDHPCIAKVLDGGATDAGRPYFVMELVRGVSITEYCDEANLSMRARLELFAEVCQAVQHAHQKGVIHRDIKPSNVMVTLHDGKPVPKVIDFGIAKAMHTRLTEKTLFTEFRRFIGTPTYMSPEQAEMSGLDVDTRTDIYSLGVLLYELLTGTTPFDAKALIEHGMEKIRDVIREQPAQRPSLRISTSGSAQIAARRRLEVDQLSRQLRGDLDWIVMRALEKERTRRYSSASEFAADIRRHLADEPVLAGPPSATYRLRKFLARNRAAVVFASVLALALLGGISATTAAMLTARRHADDAQASQAAALAQRESAEQARDEEARQAQLAQDEAERARVVMGFLVDTLSLADPEVVLDPDVTVRTLLDRTATRLEEVFIDEPEAEIALRATIGRAYASLSETRVAEANLRRAVELSDQIGRTSGFALYELLWDLTTVAFTNEATDSYAVAHRARSVGIDHIGASHPVLAEALRRFISATDQADEAAIDVTFPDVVSKANATLLAGDPLWIIVAESFIHASYSLWYGPYEAKTELMWIGALDILRRERPANHPQIAEVLNQLVGVLNRQGKLGQAEDYIREGLALVSSVLPDEAFQVANAKSMLGENLAVQGRFEEAEPLLLAGHATILATVPDQTTFYVVDSFGRLLRLYDAWGRPEDAEPYRRELLDRTARAKWLQPWAITSLLFAVRDAELRDTLDQLEQTCGNPYTSPFDESIRPTDEVVVPIARAAIERLDSAPPEDVELRVIIGRNMVSWAATFGTSTESLARRLLLERAWQLLEPAVDDVGLDASELLAHLAVLAAEDGNEELAAELTTRAWDIARTLTKGDNWFMALAKVRLADSLLARGHHEWAEQLLLPAYEVLRRNQGEEHVRTRHVRERLVALYESWGRPGDAAGYREDG